MRTSPPDLLITDLSLPGIDGFELIALVRKDPVLRRTPIICLSGYGGPGHEQRAREAGCDRILQKPYMPDALAAVALEVMRSARSRGIEAP
jgi:two-component system CheB/CheR fusion protein